MCIPLGDCSSRLHHLHRFAVRLNVTTMLLSFATKIFLELGAVIIDYSLSLAPSWNLEPAPRPALAPPA